MTKTTQLTAALAIALGAAFTAHAERAAVGDQLPAFELKDSAGNKRMLGDDVRRIYGGADRASDKLIKSALEKDGQAMLDAQQAIVVADISDVPFFIKGLVRSDLEERSYLTWTDEDEITRKFFPYREDRITVLELDKRRVTAIRYVKSVAELKKELAPPAPATPAAAEAPAGPEPAAPPGTQEPPQPEPADGDL